MNEVIWLKNAVTMQCYPDTEQNNVVIREEISDDGDDDGGEHVFMTRDVTCLMRTHETHDTAQSSITWYVEILKSCLDQSVNHRRASRGKILKYYHHCSSLSSLLLLSSVMLIIVIIIIVENKTNNPSCCSQDQLQFWFVTLEQVFSKI